MVFCYGCDFLTRKEKCRECRKVIRESDQGTAGNAHDARGEEERATGEAEGVVGKVRGSCHLL